jgi:hypothetical protein
MSVGGQKLQARNSHQVLGKDLILVVVPFELLEHY